MDIPDYLTEGFNDLLNQLYDLLPAANRPKKCGMLISEIEISPNRDIEIVQRFYNLIYFINTHILPLIKNSSYISLLPNLLVFNNPEINVQYNALFDQNGHFATVAGRRSYYASGIFTYTIKTLFEQAVKRCEEKKAGPSSMEHLFTYQQISNSVKHTLADIENDLFSAATQQYKAYLLQVDEKPQKDELDKNYRKEIPILILHKNDVWIYGLDLEGNTQLTQLENPNDYKGLFASPFGPVTVSSSTKEIPSKKEVYAVTSLSEEVPAITELKNNYAWLKNEVILLIRHGKDIWIYDPAKEQLIQSTKPNLYQESFKQLRSKKLKTNQYRDIRSIKGHVNPAEQCIKANTVVNEINKITSINEQVSQNLAIGSTEYQTYEENPTRNVASTRAFINFLQQVAYILNDDKKYKNSYIDTALEEAAMQIDIKQPNKLFFPTAAVKKEPYRSPTLPSPEVLEAANASSTALGKTIEEGSATLARYLTTLKGDLALGELYEALLKEVEKVKTDLLSVTAPFDANIDGCYQTALSKLDKINFSDLPKENETYLNASEKTKNIYQEQFNKARLETKTHLETRWQFHKELIKAFDEQKNAILVLEEKLGNYANVEKIFESTETELNALSEALTLLSEELKISADTENTLITWKEKKHPSEKLTNEFLVDFNNSQMAYSIKKNAKTLEASIREKLNDTLAAINTRQIALEAENTEKIVELNEKVNNLSNRIEHCKEAYQEIKTSHSESMLKRAELLLSLGISKEAKNFDTLASLYLNVEQRETSLYSKIEKKQASLAENTTNLEKQFIEREKIFSKEEDKLQKLTEFKQLVAQAFNKEIPFENTIKMLSSEKILFQKLLGEKDYEQLLIILNQQHRQQTRWLPSFRYFYNDKQTCQAILEESIELQSSFLKVSENNKNKTSKELTAAKEDQQAYTEKKQALQDFDKTLETDFSTAMNLKQEINQLTSELEITQLRLQATLLRTKTNQQKNALQTLEESINKINPSTSIFSGNLTNTTQWDNYCKTHQNILETLSNQLSQDLEHLISLQKALQSCTEAQQTLQKSLDKTNPIENKEIQSFIQINLASLQDIEKFNKKQQELKVRYQIKLNELDNEKINFSAEKDSVSKLNENLLTLTTLIPNIENFTKKLLTINNLSMQEKDHIINATENSIYEFKATLEKLHEVQLKPPITQIVFEQFINQMNTAKKELLILENKKEEYIQEECRTYLINCFAQLDNNLDDKEEYLRVLADVVSQQYPETLAQFILDTLAAIGKQKREDKTEEEHLKAQRDYAITVMKLLAPKLATVAEVNKLQELTNIRGKEKDSPYGFIRLEDPPKGNDIPQYSNTRCWSEVIKPIKIQLFKLASAERSSLLDDKTYQASRKIMQTHRRFGLFSTTSFRRLEKLKKEQQEKTKQEEDKDKYPPHNSLS